jgi:iron complex transport system substrate-binding protein
MKSIKKHTLLPIIFALFPLLCLCRHSLGSEPERIISLAPSITKQIYLLGAQDRLTACTVYCKIARNKPRVGTALEVNVEEIVSLKPDLVLTTPLTNPRAIQKLRNLKTQVIELPLPKNFDELSKQFLELGRIVGEEARAKDIVDEARKRVKSIKDKVEDLPKPKVFLQLGAKPIFAATRDSFTSDFIELAGGINILGDSKSGFYSREKVLEQNPDVILIVTMGIVGENEKRKWEQYPVINAVKNNRVHIIDSDKVCSPTPSDFATVLQEIAGILHPELRKTETK